MIDLATITATLARDRVAEQFAGQHVNRVPAGASAAPATVRRAAIRGLRALADRLDPAPRKPAVA
jgi:hypothetical protein